MTKSDDTPSNVDGVTCDAHSERHKIVALDVSSSISTSS